MPKNVNSNFNASLERIAHEYHEIANPAAVAWEWTSGGRAHQLVWSRDESPIVYCIKSDGDRSWTFIPSQHDKMSGIASIKAARLVAEWFINGHMLPEHDEAYAITYSFVDHETNAQSSNMSEAQLRSLLHTLDLTAPAADDMPIARVIEQVTGELASVEITSNS